MTKCENATQNEAETMNKVLIPNLPTRYDAVTKKRVPALDLNPAAKFGNLVIACADPHVEDDPNVAMDAALEQIQRAVSEMYDEDFILCVGDVVLIAACIAYANDKNGMAKVLRWNKNSRDYDIVEVVL